MSKPSVIFVSHGGGPLPLLGDSQHVELVSSMRQLGARSWSKIQSIVVLSAHWETQGFSVTSGPVNHLLFDYAGFPASAYQLRYPAPGHPALAQQLKTRLSALGFELNLQPERGIDHGVFVPLLLLFPAADIPVLQVSLENHLQPERHLAFAQALAESLDETTLVIGSGFTYHNLPGFFAPKSVQLRSGNEQFLTWLDRTLCAAELSHSQRLTSMTNWEQAPAARVNHPREEHLLPLFMCAAIAQTPARSIEFEVMGLSARHYDWSAPA